MEKSFRLSTQMDNGDALRAQLQFAKAEGRTVITIDMTVPNQLSQMSLAQAQAEVLRMAIEDLQAERAAHLALAGTGTQAT